jgi:hypothetical protein
MSFSWTSRLLLFVLLLLGGSSVHAQTPRVRISLSPPATIEVQATGLRPATSWSFRNAVAGTLGLADRVRDFATPGNLAVQKVATGVYRTSEATASISYRLQVPPLRTNEVAHVSMINGDFALLLLRDVLPIELGNCAVEFKLPADWSVYTSSATESPGVYLATDSAVFVAGRSIQREEKRLKGVELELLIGDRFPVSDRSILKSSEQVTNYYLKLTGQSPANKVSIVVAPFSFTAGNVRWKAETIGSTVILFIDRQAPFTNWQGQFGVILTHELFHLWVPNALRLTGEYDWFFEGFTLYTALLTALKLKLISFQEYLNTIARVYDSYLSYPDLSLIDASERRWLGNGAAVYDKGMLAAFVYDLMVRRESHSKKTVTDLYRLLFTDRTVETSDANGVIIRLLMTELPTFSRSYIDRAARLELEKLLPEFGLRLDSSGSTSKISVAESLTAAQKQLVKSLQYRN